MVLNEELSYLIYSVVEEIPEGSVATYGQIAKLIGRPKNARLVGRALKQAGRFSLPQSCKLQGETDTRLGGTSRLVRKGRGYNERCMACGFEEASMESMNISDKKEIDLKQITSKGILL